MRRTFLLFLACGVLVLSRPVMPGAARAEEPNRIVPASGGAEVEGIKVICRSALSAEKTAEPKGMGLDFWFPADWKSKDIDISRPDGPGIHPFIRIKSLDPIEDDTGKLLLTAARREMIHCLRDEVHGTSSLQTHGKRGPIVSMALEAPARRAEAIKSIKGKAEITLAKEVRVTFADLDAINGKELEHPDFPGLRDMKLKFAIKEEEGHLTAKMSAPFNFTDPWIGRLQSWRVVDGEKELWWFPIGGVRSGKDGATVESRTHYRESLKGLSLRLVVMEPVETVTFDFDFQNVPLP